MILEGNRPMTSNMISVGMMNCRPVKSIKNPQLEAFMNSKAAKDNGVILISFGSLIKPDLVSLNVLNYRDRNTFPHCVEK